jgi:hypothetical protein
MALKRRAPTFLMAAGKPSSHDEAGAYCTGAFDPRKLGNAAITKNQRAAPGSINT